MMPSILLGWHPLHYVIARADLSAITNGGHSSQQYCGGLFSKLILVHLMLVLWM